MPSQSDLVAFSPKGHLVLIVECKGGMDASPRAAARFRRNLLAHGLIPPVPYYMLAYPGTLFVWKQSTPAEAEADFKASTGSILEHYALGVADPTAGIAGSTLEIVLYSWLGDLTSGLRKPRGDSDADAMLVRAGIYDEIRNGKISSRLAL